MRLVCDAKRMDSCSVCIELVCSEATTDMSRKTQLHETFSQERVNNISLLRQTHHLNNSKIQIVGSQVLLVFFH
jgi:hypothetical protein